MTAKATADCWDGKVAIAVTEDAIAAEAIEYHLTEQRYPAHFESLSLDGWCKRCEVALPKGTKAMTLWNGGFRPRSLWRIYCKECWDILREVEWR